MARELRRGEVAYGRVIDENLPVVLNANGELVVREIISLKRRLASAALGLTVLGAAYGAYANWAYTNIVRDDAEFVDLDNPTRALQDPIDDARWIKQSPREFIDKFTPF